MESQYGNIHADDGDVVTQRGKIARRAGLVPCSHRSYENPSRLNKKIGNSALSVEKSGNIEKLEALEIWKPGFEYLSFLNADDDYQPDHQDCTERFPEQYG